ncbi:MAG: hypothetical protein OWR52_09745 [Acidibacillus sp.]|uniref:Uncharacterized protein n=1 Tax=Sulfoacidibacillus ferrooxidans TaxID=2005001 RepID=A0A9X1V9C1_9BACL|nr:hypothetical protein [Sulfoacidibacillus ferrooxidans]MCI0183244.1 hypothetical protein [Sulfoacidibacillus ferrooxidans]MCY0893776.1 hypothetical protein [Acidibacillus sp.]
MVQNNDKSHQEKLTNELRYITNTWQTIQNEEFPEGPYGASLYPHDRLGKVTPWEPQQQVTSAFKDENPAFSSGTVPPPGSEPPGNQLEE